ncbi:MAG: glycine oxidase ThiO [Armatimonadota bacterium]|nr:glycine oxidase ThiO [Armatimonadota bacterium]MDR5702090.1 glycine oxidase ThiO [Armatimonadota bacterium]MDR7434615.1 glycine oxidase ThiO [Armatimonadota bacterium]
MARTADAVIVGGGVIGCVCAYHLVCAGVRRVVVLERGEVGGEASGASAGMLVPQSEASGPGPFLDLGLFSRSLFPRLRDELRERAGVDIEYLPWGTLLIFEEGEEEAALGRQSWQKSLGLRAEVLPREEVLRLEPALRGDIGGALFLPDDHHLNNVELVRALATAARSLGATILEHTPALELLVEGDRVIGVRTPEDSFLCGTVILANGCWTPELTRPLGRPLPVQPARGQIVYTELPHFLLHHVVWGKGGYLVPRLNGGILAGSTVEFVGMDKRVTLEAVSQLSAMAFETIPALRSAPLIRAWAGLRPHSPDDLPLIGPLPGVEGLVVATGHFRNGILFAPLTGILVKEMVLGEPPSVDPSPLSPGRFFHSSKIS